MHRVRPLFVLLWTALWLVGAIHCPLESLGLLADDHCCAISRSPSGEAGLPARPDCSYEESAGWLSLRADDLSPAPGPLVAGDLPPVLEPCLACGFEPLPQDTLAPGLAQGWQFLWRTALAPRAPSLVG